MARRHFVYKYDEPEIISKAIDEIEAVFLTLRHPKTRASVKHCIGGLKAILFDLKKPEHVLKEASKKKREISAVSRASAKNVMQRWTDSDDAFVLDSDLSDFDIGARIGRSKDAVHTRRMRLLKGKKVIRI